ncbi:MAG TPA: winged helix DNA-binding domain-containing protein [Frankiaceae bacterium]|nr:winged helix DNA-binding domain-containing protein [Frankiaceae bacterium]
MGEPFADPVAAVGWFGAVQSQEFAGSAWAVGQRCAGLDEAGFRAAFDAGSLLRTHVLRPTWHLVAPADLRWMQALTAPRVHAANAAYYRRSELDPATLARSGDLIGSALAGGPHLTRKELGAALAEGGVEPGDAMRLGLVMMWCELEALVCSGAMRGRQHTYALVDERIPVAATREPDDAIGELARRYFASHGPANVADFAWWSGLTKTQAGRAIAIGGRSAAEAPSPTPAPAVHLLPNFDEYVVAYQDRSALFPSAAMAQDLAGMNVLASAVVLHRGRVAGDWKRTLEGSRVRVEVNLRVALSRTAHRALEVAARRYGRFLGKPVDLESGRIDA